MITAELAVCVKGLVDFDEVASFGVSKSGGKDFSKFFVAREASVVSSQSASLCERYKIDGRQGLGCSDIADTVAPLETLNSRIQEYRK